MPPRALPRPPLRRIANRGARRTMRLVGLYYRTAAEEFFPAMGAIQMPMLGWTKVNRLAPTTICQQCCDGVGLTSFNRMRWRFSLRNVATACVTRACMRTV